MNNESSQTQCDSCGGSVPPYDGVYLSGEHATGFLCSKCYNESFSDASGLNFDHLSFHPIALADKDEENHTFHFRTHLYGENVFIEALEIKDGVPRG